MFEKFADGLKNYSPQAARHPWWRLTLESVGLAIALLVLHLPYWSQPTFLDEFDNMIGGNVVAHGGAIYVDYLSQHTPVAYWISGLGQVLGAEYFGGQRLFGFAVFAVLLAGLYARNVRQFGRVPLLVVVTLVSTMHFYNPELSYTVLSDNYQAIMCLYLLFEVVGLGVRRDISLQRWVVIGLASAFAFGVAFVSIYFVAGAVLTAAVLTVIDARRILHGVGAWVRFVGARAVVFIAPFLLIIAVLVATGALLGAYEQAYVLNRTYYPLYLAFGLGSSVATPLYSGLVDIFQHVVWMPGLFASSPIAAIRELIALVVLGGVVVVFARVRIVLGVGLLWMASLVATRGWNGFHAQPLWAFMIGCLGLLVWCTAVAWRSTSRPRVPVLIAVGTLGIVTLVATLPYVATVYQSRHSLMTPVAFPNTNRSELIRTLVPEGGKYGELSINNAYDFVVTRRMPAGGFAGVVPWFSDMIDDEMADRLSVDNPVLVFSDEDNDVWGFNILENAPALASVIEQDYSRIDVTSIGVNEGVYIRTDALDDAIAQLENAFPGAEITAVQ